MHDWGDEDFDWKGLNDCVDIIYRISRYGFFSGQIKEKYGSLRWYAHFGHLSLHTLVYPGHMYSRFPNWLWKLDIHYIGPFLRFFFEKPFVFWQKMVYNHAYQVCLKHHPNLRVAIICAADYPELIKGATRIAEGVEGKILYKLGNDGEIIGTREEI